MHHSAMARDDVMQVVTSAGASQETIVCLRMAIVVPRAGVGNLRHACQARHVEQFSMAR
jgi:hypothetical protein